MKFLEHCKWQGNILEQEVCMEIILEQYECGGNYLESVNGENIQEQNEWQVNFVGQCEWWENILEQWEWQGELSRAV